LLDVRDSVPLTGHIHHFDIPAPQATESRLRKQLRAEIQAMREQGMSYRQFGAALGIYWTQVG
jgi:hypothetical protein